MKYAVKKIDRRYKANYLNGCTHEIKFEKTVIAGTRLRQALHDDWWFIELLSDLRKILGEGRAYNFPNSQRISTPDEVIWTVADCSHDTIYVKDIDEFESAMVQYKLTNGGV